KLCGEWLLEPQTVPKKEIDFVIGDLDGDDRLTIHDATVLQQFLAEFATLDLNDEKTFLKADVNGDGKVNVRDVTAIQRKLAEITP
ncbi:MAG: dockerin type I repeat-containing protein, partial [Ruminococcus sp.]|nr:dockerin type I repeat-containing protein [Ruminococcus sp.]